MTALTTEARQLLTQKLTGLGYTVYSVVPATPKTPSVSIMPDTPWITPERIGSQLQYETRWVIKTAIGTARNNEAQSKTETAVDTLLAALTNPVQVRTVSPPQYLDTGAQGIVLSTDIYVSIHMKE